MKVQLVVAQGVHAGKEIPIAVNQFVIGRDSQCQLRPASPAISKKHCAIFIRGGKVFIKDFDSTNGTFVNGDAVKGEVELRDKDHLKVGPLEFTVAVQVAAPPPPKPKVSEEEDSFAALLLEGDEGPAAAGAAPGAIPEGSTIQMTPINPEDTKAGKKDAKAAPAASTSTAAADILKLYHRRPRS